MQLHRLCAYEARTAIILKTIYFTYSFDYLPFSLDLKINSMGPVFFLFHSVISVAARTDYLLNK